MTSVSIKKPDSFMTRALQSQEEVFLTLAAAKMSLTDSAISGPIPSPSIKLTR